jgi:putative aldouronate transport system permease protein
MIQETIGDKWFLALNKLFLWILLALVVYPLVYIVSASISDPLAVNSGRMWLFPVDVTWEGYASVFQNNDIFIGYRNTTFYTLVGTTISLFITLPCAYTLSRGGVRGRGLFMAMLVFTMMFNGGIIPSYLLVRDIGIMDTVWAILLPTAATAYNIIVARTFFQGSIPQELVEAAEMDGCNVFMTFVRIVLPLSAPIIAVMGLFYGVTHWNQYFNALLYLTDRNLFPLQLYLREILVLNEMSASMMMDEESMLAVAEQARLADIIKYAVMMIASLPLLVVYPFVQRFFVKGMLIGSLKG